ncbi:hypothetical protein [Shouchella clausii]|uniref:hypothetical protein n=1 Tax=Shouchella clausii TaxID=79880 RepID=UPI00226C936C|nr:hypothetical protein [Shouchella clausii]MCY1105801.1 hypothetical protein [Shouchella clausii]
MLTKFPVTTDRGEYRVDIEKSDYFSYYYARIYQKRNVLRYFSTFKHLATYQGLYSDVEEDFVAFAKDTVLTYEDDCDAEEIARVKKRKAVEAFHAWDGDITTKEESR